MRRLGVLFAICLAVPGLLAATVAVAGAAVPASFCGTARDFQEDIGEFDFENFTDAELYEDIERVYKRLAREAPKSLKASFKTVTRYFNSLADAGDLTDPENIEDFLDESPKAVRALNKILGHLSSKCDIDLT